ncbi:MAG: ABC transporter ATP-binding protein [Candidatus Heimdallarchaeaceae archaeon]
MTSTIIKLTNVKKTFQLFWEDLVVLDNINLEIKRDELVLFYGPSGSGKTTLLNIITGLLEPDEGEVEIGGLYLDLIPRKERNDVRAKYFGIVFQENNLISTLTAKENLVLVQELIGGIDNVNEKRVDELLSKLGVKQRSNNFPSQLSGGEKKRVGIARALINNPFVI